MLKQKIISHHGLKYDVDDPIMDKNYNLQFTNMRSGQSWGTYAQRRWKWCLLHHLPRGAWNGTLFVSERPSGTTRRSASRLGNGFPERREPHETFLAWSAFWLKLSFGNRWMDAKLVELHKFKLTLDFGNRWNHAQMVELHNFKVQIYRLCAWVYNHSRSHPHI